MPVYEYKCKGCEVRFEALRPMSQSDQPIDCPRCGSAGVERQISVFAAISRGEGGSSKMIASSAPSGCGSCAGGHCASCGSH
jgi:putative FmdB family regulatory protein